MNQPQLLYLAVTAALALVLGFVGGALFAARCLGDAYDDYNELHDASNVLNRVRILELLYDGRTESAIIRLQMQLHREIRSIHERKRSRRSRGTGDEDPLSRDRALRRAAEFRAKHPWTCGVPAIDDRAQQILGSYGEPPPGAVQ